MKNYTVELDYYTIDRIITDQLIDMVKIMSTDIRERREGIGVAVFSEDVQEDIAEMNRHIDAARTVLSYYGVNLED